eukprot:1681829-Prymnesium_polylepis.2
MRRHCSASLSQSTLRSPLVHARRIRIYAVLPLPDVARSPSSALPRSGPPTPSRELMSDRDPGSRWQEHSPAVAEAKLGIIRQAGASTAIRTGTALYERRATHRQSGAYKQLHALRVRLGVRAGPADSVSATHFCSCSAALVAKERSAPYVRSERQCQLGGKRPALDGSHVRGAGSVLRNDPAQTQTLSGSLRQISWAASGFTPV